MCRGCERPGQMNMYEPVLPFNPMAYRKHFTRIRVIQIETRPMVWHCKLIRPDGFAKVN